MAGVIVELIADIEDRFVVGPNGEGLEEGLFPILATSTKITRFFHDRGSTTHMDSAKDKISIKRAVDGIEYDLGLFDGGRIIGGEGQADISRGFGFFNKNHGREDSTIPAVGHANPVPIELNGWYKMGNKWVFLMNGWIRHKNRQPKFGDGIRVYHRGMSAGGACFNIMLTLTRDVNEKEAKFILKKLLKALEKIENIFKSTDE